MAEMELRPDIAEAAARMGARFGAKRELRVLPSHLWDGELVRAVVKATYSGKIGLLVLTDRRLLFVFDGPVHQVTEDFPLDRVSSVSWHGAMLLGKIRLFAGGAAIELTNVDKTGGKMFVDAARDTVAAAGQPAAQQATAAAVSSPSPAETPSGPLDKLRQLAELRDAGVLTDDEYAAAKARLVARL